MRSKKEREQRVFDLLCNEIIKRVSEEPLFERNQLSAGLAVDGERRVRALERIVQERRGDKLARKLATILLAEMSADTSATDVLATLAAAAPAIKCNKCSGWIQLGICRCCGKDLCSRCREAHSLAAQILKELAREQDREADRQRMARRFMREALRR